MSVSSVSEKELVTPTTRIYAYLTLAFSMLVFGAFEQDEAVIAISVLLIFSTIVIRGYVYLMTSAARNLEVRIERPDIAREGSRFKVKYYLKNTSYIPLVFLEIITAKPVYLPQASGSNGALVILPPRSVLEITEEYTARIGRHTFSGLKAVVRDPLGLFKSSEIPIGFSFEVRGVPRIEEQTITRKVAFTRTIGTTRTRRAGPSGTEFHSVRYYNPGDELRRIVWRVLASRNELVVKEFELESNLYILLVFLPSYEMFWGNPLNTAFEHCLRLITSIAFYSSRKGDNIGLIIWSRKPIVSRKFHRGVGAFQLVNRMISRIDFDPSIMSTRSIDTLIKKHILPILKERTIIVFFLTPSEYIVNSLEKSLHILHLNKHAVYAVLFAPTEYEAQSLKEPVASLYKLKLIPSYNNMLSLIKRLRRVGVKTIIVDPETSLARILDILDTHRVAP